MELDDAPNHSLRLTDLTRDGGGLAAEETFGAAFLAYWIVVALAGWIIIFIRATIGGIIHLLRKAIVRARPIHYRCGECGHVGKYKQD